MKNAANDQTDRESLQTLSLRERVVDEPNDNYSEAQDVKQLPIFNQNSRSKTEFQSISNPEHREFVDNEFEFFQELDQPKEHMQTTSPMNPLS